MIRVNKGYIRLRYESNMFVEYTFTPLDWKIIDLLLDNENPIRLSSVDDKRFLKVCRNILPNGNTIL
jgi:hypothetical protein